MNSGQITNILLLLAKVVIKSYMVTRVYTAAAFIAGAGGNSLALNVKQPCMKCKQTLSKI